MNNEKIQIESVWIEINGSSLIHKDSSFNCFSSDLCNIELNDTLSLKKAIELDIVTNGYIEFTGKGGVNFDSTRLNKNRAAVTTPGL